MNSTRHQRKSDSSDAVDDVAWKSTPQETAAYIRDLLESLSTMADQARLSSLAYLLSVAADEARDRSGDGGD